MKRKVSAIYLNFIIQPGLETDFDRCWQNGKENFSIYQATRGKIIQVWHLHYIKMDVLFKSQELPFQICTAYILLTKLCLVTLS